MRLSISSSSLDVKHTEISLSQYADSEVINHSAASTVGGPDTANQTKPPPTISQSDNRFLCYGLLYTFSECWFRIQCAARCLGAELDTAAVPQCCNLI